MKINGRLILLHKSGAPIAYTDGATLNISMLQIGITTADTGAWLEQRNQSLSAQVSVTGLVETAQANGIFAVEEMILNRETASMYLASVGQIDNYYYAFRGDLAALTKSMLLNDATSWQGTIQVTGPLERWPYGNTPQAIYNGNKGQSHIAVRTDGALLVNSGSDGIKVYRNGRLVKTIQPGTSPSCVVAGPNNLWITSMGTTLYLYRGDALEVSRAGIGSILDADFFAGFLFVLNDNLSTALSIFKLNLSDLTTSAVGSITATYANVRGRGITAVTENIVYVALGAANIGVNTGAVIKNDLSTNTQTSVTLTALASVHGIKRGPDNLVYAIDRRNQEFFKVSGTTKTNLLTGGSYESIAFRRQFAYLALGTNAVGKYDVTGAQSTEYPEPNVANSYWLAISQADTIIAADYNSNELTFLPQ